MATPKYRGSTLTALLILQLISSISHIHTLLFHSYVYPSLIYRVIPSWYTVYALIVETVSLAALIGIWNWKRWGVFLYVLCVISGVITSLMTFTRWGIVFYFVWGLLITGAFLWSISKQWKYFQ